MYSSQWWSVELPSGWSVSENSDCVSFRSCPLRGILSASATRKPDGRIAVSDLAEFIEGASADAIESERYFGFTRECARGEGFLAEWWLVRGSVLVYFSYSAGCGAEASEIVEMRRIVESVWIEGDDTNSGEGADL